MEACFGGLLHLYLAFARNIKKKNREPFTRKFEIYSHLQKTPTTTKCQTVR